MSKVIFIFLDGVGLGEDSPDNPFVTSNLGILSKLCGKQLIKGIEVKETNLYITGVDACCGVEGLPQSATGQTALFTGINASKSIGCHVSAYPTKPLRKIIKEHSIFKQLSDLGMTSTFANAYGTQYHDLIKSKSRRHSASTLCVMAGGIKFRIENDLLKENAVFWDISHEVSKESFGSNYSYREPVIAGNIIASISETHDFVMYETFLPDLVGHGKRTTLKAKRLIEEILAPFLDGIINHISIDTTLVICSDHGNIEDISTKRHTRNPVPLIAYGKGSKKFHNAKSIVDVTPCIIDVLRDGYL